MDTPKKSAFRVTDPFKQGFSEPDVPRDVARELLEMANHTHTSFYYLTAIYRRGREDGLAHGKQHARPGDRRCTATDDGQPAASSKRRCVLVEHHDSSINATPHLFERDDR